MNCIEGNMERN